MERSDDYKRSDLEVRYFITCALKFASGELLFKLLVFDEDKDTLPSLMHKIRQKLDLDNQHNILQLVGGGKIEEIHEIMLHDEIEILSPA